MSIDFKEAFADDEEGLKDADFDLLEIKKIKPLMYLRLGGQQQLWGRVCLIFKNDTERLKKKYFALHRPEPRCLGDNIINYINNEEIDENGKFKDWEKVNDHIKWPNIVSINGKVKIMKYVDLIFKKNVNIEVNEHDWRYYNYKHSNREKFYLNCSIFDKEFYKMLSKKYNIHRFDDPQLNHRGATMMSSGTPNQHQLSKNVMWRKYQNREQWGDFLEQLSPEEKSDFETSMIF